MRVVIAGAGAVGRAVAQASVRDGHKVLLIEQRRSHFRPDLVPQADWMLADACDIDVLDRCGLFMCDTALAATGDDETNLVFALLAKTEYCVGRVVARITDSRNEWLFNQLWGVDVAVSAPRALTTGVDEAVTVGDIVHVMTLHNSGAELLEITLPHATAFAGVAVSTLPLPPGSAVLSLVRSKSVLAAGPDTVLQPDDTLLIATSRVLEPSLRAALRESGRD